MLRTHPDASYLLTLLEASAAGGEGSSQDGQDSTALAACAVDVASGHMLIGQW